MGNISSIGKKINAIRQSMELASWANKKIADNDEWFYASHKNFEKQVIKVFNAL